MLLYAYAGMEQLSKWMAGGGYHDSHCWGGTLDKQKEEAKMIHVVLN